MKQKAVYPINRIITGRLDLEYTDCIVCGRSGSRPFGHFIPPDIGQSFHLERCPYCRAVFVNPHPTRVEINRFFSDEGLFVKSTDPEGRQRSMINERDRRRPEFAGYVRRIKGSLPGGRALDVGCGLGLFLELLGPKFERLGLDINPLAARFVRERLDCEVQEGDAMEADFPIGGFDLISVMQTLDHFESPGVFLRRTAHWLRQGGLLFLSSLININSPGARLFKEDFRLLHPFHLAYFSPRTVRQVLSRLGFRVIRIEYPYFKTPFFNRREALGFVLKAVERLFASRNGSSNGQARRVLSPPFIGNTMNVYAIKGA
jgi:SAM-dependent methyltransferase